ncbi:hypothetical protein LINPERPRIM_LOCUS4424, partial [Linum perenne]
MYFGNNSFLVVCKNFSSFGSVVFSKSSICWLRFI